MRTRKLDRPCILCGRRHDSVQMECPPVYPGDYKPEALAKNWRYPRAERGGES